MMKYQNPKKLNFLKKFGKLVNGEPIQYITNSQEFMNLKFYVDNRVLIPQPDRNIRLMHRKWNYWDLFKREFTKCQSVCIRYK